MYNNFYLFIYMYRVQHDVVSGLKYLQVVKRKGIRGNIKYKKKPVPRTKKKL